MQLSRTWQLLETSHADNTQAVKIVHNYRCYNKSFMIMTHLNQIRWCLNPLLSLDEQGNMGKIMIGWDKWVIDMLQEQWCLINHNNKPYTMGNDIW